MLLEEEAGKVDRVWSMLSCISAIDSGDVQYDMHVAWNGLLKNVGKESGAGKKKHPQISYFWAIETTPTSGFVCMYVCPAPFRTGKAWRGA